MSKILFTIVLAVGLLQAQQQIYDSIIVFVEDTAIKTPGGTIPPFFTAVLHGNPTYSDSQKKATNISWTTCATEKIIFVFKHTQITGHKDVWVGNILIISDTGGYQFFPDSGSYEIQYTDPPPSSVPQKFTVKKTTVTATHLVLIPITNKISLDFRRYDLLGRLGDFNRGFYIQNSRPLIRIVK
jgi:hypothetical protein